MSGSWQPALVCSVIGAAHRRRGQPCQDASLSASLPAGAGRQLQLMAVADGHGASRYWLSDVGSALACRQAQQAVEELLAQTPLEAHGRWREALQQQLPAAIQRGWLAAIEADWQQRPEAQEQAFSPQSYGCTLGLVLLAPGWWGCTGLGDWDLVQVDSTGAAQLINEEADALASGEATASLCLPGATALCSGRAQLETIDPAGGLQGLVLSTDGIRKSCATDADFLSLCAQVLPLQDPRELEQGLEQISREGSGDDVSVAIARRATTATPRRQGRMAMALMAAGLALLAGGGWWWLQRRPPEPAALQQQRRQLCAQPATIKATLQQRHSQFRRLLAQPAEADALLAAAARDPLGALIAASLLQHPPGCKALALALQASWHQAAATPAPANGRMPSLPAAAPPAPQ